MKRKDLRYFFGLLVMVALAAYTGTVAAQGTTQEIPLKDALKKITKTFGTQFVYDPELFVKKSTNYNLDNLKDKQVEEVLKGILYPHNLVFLYVKTNYYSIVPKDRIGDVAASGAAPAATASVLPAGQISGIVTDEGNLPLIGASVKVKGTNVGVQTGADGRFSLAASGSSPLLVVSFVGYDDY